MRRIESAAGDEHLAVRARGADRVALPVFHPDRAASLKQNTGSRRVGDDREIGPAARRPQVADGGRAAAAVARGELEIADALLCRPVEIIITWEARLLRRGDESLAQGMRLAYIRDGKRAVDPVQRVLSALLVFGAPEIRQHILKAPAGVAELAPMIEVR